MLNSHIFVSYSRQDTFFVQYFLQEMNSRFGDKFTFWYDVTDIDAGEKWKPAIDFALDNSFCILVICTPDSMKSHQVTYEWSFAIAKEVDVIPILYKSSVEEIHERLREFNAFAAWNPNSIRYDALESALNNYLQKHLQQVQSSSKQYNIESIRRSISSTEEAEIINGLRFALLAADNELMENILPLTQHNYFRIRQFALQALANIDNDKVIDILIDDLCHENHSIRQFSLSQAKFHARLRPQDWTNRLLKEISNDERFTVVSGVPIGRINAILIMNHLAFMENYDYKVFDSFFDFGNTLIDLLSHENVDLVAVAIKILGNMGYEKARQKFSEFSEDKRLGFYEESDNGEIIRQEISIIAKQSFQKYRRQTGEALVDLEKAFARFKFAPTNTSAEDDNKS